MKLTKGYKSSMRRTKAPRTAILGAFYVILPLQQGDTFRGLAVS